MINYKVNPELGIVVVAGGSGSRFGRGNKLLAKLAGVPVFIHSLKNFHGLCPPGNLVLVVKKSETAEFADAIRKYLPGVDVRIAYGGKTRMHSVMSGLSILPLTAKFVAVHDAARPLARSELLIPAYRAARRHGGAVVAKRMTDTVKQSNRKCIVIRTLDRSCIWQVETPQIFPLESLMAAYVRAFAKELELTDDSAVMEMAGQKPYLFEYKLPNLKITYPEDLKIAETYLDR
ncbi:MAG TPA: 2-C-methyl-D-erythritol 4-phosphate cytidylyltransferase [Lentisphaeria bacterium]|nr:MAG: 2-C-methyl-D-erythritol 4-phosphate cytidylyltransferase [Lentisphaerae bacterium GWF2_49_21]HBC88957.1 2-C-methyl-D-erythritol 4-phosphate cytidylyltransferase [Lentisphaeria bacterium]